MSDLIGKDRAFSPATEFFRCKSCQARQRQTFFLQVSLYFWWPFFPYPMLVVGSTIPVA